MSHVTIIISRQVLPPPEAPLAEPNGDMSAEIIYKPADNLSDKQIGEQVGRIIHRLNKLADD